jgi:predicted RNase H-related nuclease YkuK (DUF458 family)
MAVSVDWYNQIIFVPRADMTLIQSSPTEIRELDLNAFRLELKALEASEEGMAYLDTHNHNTTVTVGGVTLARVIEIINGYTITFEDGQYAVNLVGANSNVADVTNVNQVSIRSGNSAGLVTSAAIEYGEYEARVTVDPNLTTEGTVYPIGTRRSPCGNLPDALLIAQARGFKEIHFLDSITIDSGLNFSGFTFSGASDTETIVTINPSANVINCIVTECTVQGTLDGGSQIDHAIVKNINFFNGIITESIVDGPITLGGTNEAILMNCVSGVAGANTPYIDMGGDGPPLMLRNWNGGIELRNKTGTTYPASIDINSGQVKIANTVSNGTIVVRGIGKLTDNSIETANVVAEIIDSANLNKVLYTDGAVHLDTTSIYSGTAFPNGIGGRPVNNIDDALAIVADTGLMKISMNGVIEANTSHNLDGITFVAGSGSSDILYLNGASTSESEFKNIILYGTLGGLSRIRDCIIGSTGLGNLTEVEGRIVDCIINHANGVIQKTSGAGTLFENCQFTAPFNPRIEVDANGKSLGFDQCSGNFLIKNKTDSESNQINILGGTVEITASCTGGEFVIDGSGTVVDNNGGTTVTNNISSASAGQIAGAVWDKLLVDHTTDTTFGGRIQKLLTKIQNLYFN